MLKAFVFGLIGLGLSVNPSYASNLKIGSWVVMLDLAQVVTIQELEV